MKKLIAILMVLAIVAGFAFADTINGDSSNGTAVINVKAKINELQPVFQLYAKTITTQDSESNGDVLYSAVNNGSPVPGQVTIETDHLLSTDAVIVFAIRQTNKSRSTAHYTLGVAATDLKLDNYATVGTTALDDDEFFAVALSELAADTNYGATSTKGVKITPSTSSFTAVYDGKVVNANESNLELATFKATWTKKPLAVAGNYSATVTLTITATN